MILADHSEPDNLLGLIRQTVEVMVMPLNQTKRSDYYFGGEDSKTRQFGRVQAGELLSNIDSMEDELRRYYSQADENFQIIEGVISSVPLTKKSKTLEAVSIRRQARPNTLFSYKISESGFIHGEQAWNISASMLDSWIYQLSEAGIITYYTENYVRTARLLATIYRNCQKPADEHTTLNRYIKPRLFIKERNPYIETLMGIKGADLGEVKATALIKYFKDPLSVFMASPEDIANVDGFGIRGAEKILKSIGRKL